MVARIDHTANIAARNGAKISNGRHPANNVAAWERGEDPAKLVIQGRSGMSWETCKLHSHRQACERGHFTPLLVLQANRQQAITSGQWVVLVQLPHGAVQASSSRAPRPPKNGKPAAWTPR